MPLSPISPSQGILKNNKIAFVGDSITHLTINGDTANTIYDMGHGYSFWVQFLTKQRFYTDHTLNFGVSGNKTSDVLARMGPILAANCGVYVLMIGVNDLGNSIAPATAFANIQAIVRQLVSIGAVVIVCEVLQSTNYGPYPQTCHLNRLIHTLPMQFPGCFVAPVNRYWVNPNLNTGAPYTGYSSDGTHPVPCGAYAVALPIVDILNSLPGSQIGPLCTTYSDSYNSSSNPSGNLLNAGGQWSPLTGTAGSITAPLSGTLASGWSAQAYNAGTANFTSLTGVISMPSVTQADPRQWAQIVLGDNGTPINGGYGAWVAPLFLQPNINSELSPGDTVQAAIDCYLGTDLSNVFAVSLYFGIYDGSTFHVCETGCNGSGDNYPGITPVPGYQEGRFLTPPFTVPNVTISFIYVQARIYPVMANSIHMRGTIQFANPALFKNTTV